MEKSFSESYKQAGVDVTAGYKSVELMKKSVRETYTKGVISDLGGFGGLFSIDVKQMEEREAERLRIEEEKRLEEEAMAALLAEEENGEETGTRAAEDMQIV